MNEEQLSIYLNDHFAGAIAGIDLARSCLDENRQNRVGDFMTHLLEELQEDQKTLKGVIQQLGVREERIKKVSGWLAEKANRLRLAAGSKYADLRRLEELEMLLVGIRGKLALWETMEQVGQADPRLREENFRTLQERARRQMDQVEAERIKAARQTFLGE